MIYWPTLPLNQVKQRVAQEMANERNLLRRTVLSRALTLGKQALENRSEGELLIDGQTNLMDQPEFKDVVRLRGIFQAFEEKSHPSCACWTRP